jgi:hypothetical protein
VMHSKNIIDYFHYAFGRTRNDHSLLLHPPSRKVSFVALINS